jgi:hypothetical protein
MVGMMEKLRNRYRENPKVSHIPIVMIGHSKEPVSFTELRAFLYDVSRRFGDSLEFVTYRKAIQQYMLTDS